MLQNWDQLVMLLVGVAVVLHSGRTARRLWRQNQKKASVGVMCTGLAALLLPIILAVVAH